MFIAHAPSGYVLSKLFLKCVRKKCVNFSLFVSLGVFGAFFPDLDMIYYYFVDGQQTLHHKYITHWPIVWLTLIFVALCGFQARRWKIFFVYLFIFSLGGFLHILLDSFVGYIYWFAPFDYRSFALFTVPSRFGIDLYVLNFIFHWTFILELLICFWAILICKSRNGSNKSVHTTPTPL